MLMEIAAAQHLIESAGDDAGGNGEKAAGEDSEVLNVDQLRIAMSIDRCDIARTKILTDAKKWTQNDLEPLMLQALRDNQTEFAELMVEQGFSLNAYVKDSPDAG
uniref:ANK_REP_REGION domain-containing protein n=1 Tax=Macrostomum lignano TaxID=282301 RepID=A0A1I8FQX2_9PLAT